MKSIGIENVELSVVGGMPIIMTRKRLPDELATELHEWLDAVRRMGSTMLGSKDSAWPMSSRDNREDIDPKNAGFSSDPEPTTDKRHGVTVTVGGEFSDITRDGFVIHVDDKVARGLVHAIGHLMAAHHDQLPLIMLASIMNPEAAREFDGLAKLGAALVEQGVENVEVEGVPLIKSGKVFVP